MDPTLYAGGPIVKDKVFFFGSSERILESRDLNFVFDPTLPQSLVDFETPFNKHSLTHDTRTRARLDENLSQHRLSEQINYTNTHVTDYLPLLAALNLPDTRKNLDSRTMMLGLNDVWTIGNSASAWIVSSYVQYRGNPSRTSPSHPQAGIPNNLFNRFAQGKTGRVLAIYHMMSENDIETALKFPWTSIGSDAGTALTPGGGDALGLPHPRSYGNFPRVIARFVREKHTLMLPDAIRKMTSWPATRMRIADRGLIREGMWADAVVFDYDKIQDRSTYEQPDLSPEGIDYVLVNGHVVVDHGRPTGARPGKVIYGPGYRQ